MIEKKTKQMNKKEFKKATIKKILSSAAKPGTHFLENNKIIGVFTMLKLCVSKERNM